MSCQKKPRNCEIYLIWNVQHLAKLYQSLKKKSKNFQENCLFSREISHSMWDKIGIDLHIHLLPSNVMKVRNIVLITKDTYRWRSRRKSNIGIIEEKKKPLLTKVKKLLTEFFFKKLKCNVAKLRNIWVQFLKITFSSSSFWGRKYSIRNPKR